MPGIVADVLDYGSRRPSRRSSEPKHLQIHIALPDQAVINSGRIHDPGNAAEIIAAMAKHKEWIVNCQIPTIDISNPAALVGYVLYYAVGTAISDQRMLWDKDGEVGFKIKPRRGRDGKIIKGSPRSMSLPKQEILDRVVSHILPMRFRRVRMSGLYATNEHDQLAIARTLIQAAAATESKQVSAGERPAESDSLESEFSGDREGQTTYRVRCQKCVQQPPMLRECRLPGRDTMRNLAFITLMQLYLSGKRSKPPEPRPSGLPSYFARIEDPPPLHLRMRHQLEIELAMEPASGLPVPTLIETHPP